MGNCPGVSQALCMEVCWGETALRRWGRHWGRDPRQAQRSQEGGQKVMHLNLPHVSPRRTSTAGAGGAWPGQAELEGALRRELGL